MRNFASFVPAPGDRAFFAGQTGSGKTTLARELLKTREHVVVLDAKGTLDWPGYVVVADARQAAALAHQDAPPKRITIRPGWRDLTTRDWTALDDVFRFVYLRGRCTLYIDETYAVTNGNEYPDHYGACLTRGRELGVEVWSATQRPMDIPQIAMSEAEHAYVFKLKLPQDRAKVERLTGVPGDRVAALPKRHFLYARQDADVEGPFTLALPSPLVPLPPLVAGR